MSGRAATINIIPGKYALSVGRAEMRTPKGWQWVPLGDIARLESGHTPSREHPEYWDGDIAWIGIKDARAHHGGVIGETFQTVTQAGLDNSAARLLPAGTVCLSRTASVGYVVVMGREMATSQDFVNWVCGPAIDPHFLKQLFIAENESLFRFGKGSTHTTIYYPEVKAFHICLPPINEQRRIVAKVEGLTARSRRAKAALDAVPPLLDRLRQSILAAAFCGDLTADWRAKNPSVEPADKLLARIHAARRSRWEAVELAKMAARGKQRTDDRWMSKYQDARLPEYLNGEVEVPPTWTVVSVDAITECLDARRVPMKRETRSQGAVPYYGANGQVGTIGDFIFDEELVLVTEDETFYGRTKPIAYRVSGKCWVNNHAHVLRTLPPLDPDFLCQLLMHYPVWPWLSGTTGRAKLTQGALAALPVPLPPLAEIAEITRRVKSMLEGVQRLGAQLGTRTALLHDLDRSILAKAFRGELVPQDPNDEPASVLLERIRATRDSAELAGAGSRRRSRKAEAVVEAPGEGDDDDGDDAPQPAVRPEPVRPAAKDLSELDPEILQAAVFSSLWTHGPLEKDDAVRRVAEHLRQAGYVDFQRLRADGPLYGQVLEAIESAVKAGRLDRPQRGHVRACKADATAYTMDDWRHVLLTRLRTEPVNRDEAIRAAAEWARDNLGLEFVRLRSDGHVVEGLRSAINSAIRRGEVTRHSATHISRAASDGPPATGQLSLTLSAPAAGASRGDDRTQR